jgi:ribonuclease Z
MMLLDHHTSPREAGLVFARARPKLAAYTHLVLLAGENIAAPSTVELIAQTRETYDGPLEVGEDLTSFEIADGVTVRRPPAPPWKT